MSAATKIAPAVASVYPEMQLREKEPLQSYLKIVSYLFKTFAGYQTIVKIVLAILRYTQPASTNLLLYADDL